MGHTKRALAVALFFAVGNLPGQVLNGKPVKRAPQPTISRVFADLEHAETNLNDLAGLRQRGAKPAEIQKALRDYTRSLSRFHVEFGRFRTGPRQRDFIYHLSSELRDQLAKVERLAEKDQPARRIGWDKATGHLKGALEMVNGRKHRTGWRRFLTIRGIRPEQQGSADIYIEDPAVNRSFSRGVLWGGGGQWH